MGVPMVADPRQALDLAVARMIRDGHQVRPVHACAPGGGMGCAPRAPRLHEQPDGAGSVSHVCVVVGGGASRSRRSRRPLVGPQRFGLLVPADHRRARIVRPAIELPHRFHRGHEVRRAHGRIAPLDPTPRRQFVFLACSAPSRSGCGAQSPAPSSRASARNVPRAWPAGGVDWANCKSCASPAPSRRLRRDALARRSRTADRSDLNAFHQARSDTPVAPQRPAGDRPSFLSRKTGCESSRCQSTGHHPLRECEKRSISSEGNRALTGCPININTIRIDGNVARKASRTSGSSIVQ